MDFKVQFLLSSGSICRTLLIPNFKITFLKKNLLSIIWNLKISIIRYLDAIPESKFPTTEFLIN